MVNTTAVCEGCGTSLDPHEEPRDLAHVADTRHYCAPCRLLYCEAPSPTRPVATPRSSFGLEPKRLGA